MILSAAWYKAFMRKFHERKAREQIINELEQAIGEELVKAQPDIGPDAADALARAGVWVDAPKPPKFEDVDAIVGNPINMKSGVPFAQIFPIHKWTEAYEHYKFQIRIFSYSEYWNLTSDAAKAAMKRVLKISGDDFYNGIRRDRH